MRKMIGRGRVTGVALAVLLLAPSSGWAASAQVPLTPDRLGFWTGPFEEGGEDVPRCVTTESGRIVCKPTAVNAAVLKDGRVLYMNGLEGTENGRQPSPLSISPQAVDSRSRLLDLRSGTPQWTVPGDPRGAFPNPTVDEGQELPGTLGVPGRPGDGFVGSAWGQAGLPPSEPTDPPDDPQENDADFFCSDLVSLADGRILDVGGTDWYSEPGVVDREGGAPADVGLIELEGLRTTRIFDPDTNSWDLAGYMKYGRWYPGLVVLGDGDVFVASGTTKLIKDTQASQVRRTETYDVETATWTENYTGPASENTLPQNPRLYLMPNGEILYNGVGQMWGPFGQAVDEALYALQQLFNPATATWEIAGVAPFGARSGAFEVMLPLSPPYDSATVMTFGGTLGPPPGSYVATPFTTLTTVDKLGNLTNDTTGDLNIARWFASGVLLPDGTVLAVGGADRDEVIDPGTEFPIHTPEIYDPKTGTWRTVAAHTRDRTYHNSALLLPSGRVLLGGHSPLPAHLAGPNRDQGQPFANNDKDPSFEVYSPPYLFRGPRPEILGVQAGVSWGQEFTIRTAEAREIESVALVRTPSPQHVIDSDQRMLYLPFTRAGDDTLTAVAPPSGTVAPPGYYYLFVNRRSPEGPIPSVARMVRLSDVTNPEEALQPFPADAAPPVGGTATDIEEEGIVASTPERIGEIVGDIPGAPPPPAQDATHPATNARNERKNRDAEH